MTIVVTGATGHLGQLVVKSLLAKGVPADEIIATGRSAEKLAELGVPTRIASYDDPEQLRAAFDGADKVLLISSSENGKRVEQHGNVIEAAKAAGVGHLYYTSAPKADTTDMKLAVEHLATENLLRDSGIPSTFLRNSWYVENYNFEAALAHGLFGAAGEGKISGAPRADYAEAAASALLLDDPKQVYELGGEGFTLAELAAEISASSGQTVTYTDLPEQKYAEVLTGVGVPAEMAEILADSDSAASRGALFVPVDDLATLLGRPATPLATAVKAQLS